MNDSYIDQKIEEVLFYENFAELDRKKKFIRLILEAVWLSGKIEGTQKAREILK